jgi:diguanylate cyclase (GGDEF)-like protein
MLYIDLDGLKQVNDECGHEAGDRLIRSAAKVLRESFRESDILGRIGGDEFVVFATSTTAPIEEMCERMQRNVDYYNSHFVNEPTLSLSTGAVRCDPHSPTTLEDLIHQADAAMYIEKRRKRSRLQYELPE